MELNFHCHEMHPVAELNETLTHLAQSTDDLHSPLATKGTQECYASCQMGKLWLPVGKFWCPVSGGSSTDMRCDISSTDPEWLTSGSFELLQRMQY